ncbi:hypothetical protein AMK21_04640 [Streptomyces sp. CB00316]|uniref:hypothetical protein n=1 Tax=Streptomyces sp. ISL-112 TaxID=2819176 RepID=UPI00093C2D1A|nr:hypothetical protein [Streptomyces sp. ISL-112]MBT2425208.1 hypothetical protein [Streptomyces sp. ISL-112]OKJ22374.1 hypothetical protein AMK21_04640 [Streptomyces sp. CB00316]
MEIEAYGASAGHPTAAGLRSGSDGPCHHVLDGLLISAFTLTAALRPLGPRIPLDARRRRVGVPPAGLGLAVREVFLISEAARPFCPRRGRIRTAPAARSHCTVPTCPLAPSPLAALDVM